MKLIKKKVLVYGNFNIVHPGHLRLLKFARECGSKLLVAVFSDRVAGSSVIIPEHMRLEGFKNNNLVDEAFVWDASIEELIMTIRPDIVVKGREYEARFNHEQASIESYGGKLLFSSGDVAFSSMELLRNEFVPSSFPEFKAPNDYMERHNIQQSDFFKVIEEITKLKVIVVGDLIVDEYITCEPLGMSQEDPTLVVTPLDSTKFIGGASIVAAHASGLGAKVVYIGVSGDDANHSFATKSLKGYKVNSSLLVDASRPTTLKKRYRAKGKTLLRVSHLHQHDISIDLQEKILEIIRVHASEADLLVFSDFNYGCLPQSLVVEIEKICKNFGVRMAADSQSSSQSGDILKYSGMMLITPTEREARLAIRGNDGLLILAANLARESGAENVLITLAEEGVLIYSPNLKQWSTDQVKSLNLNPKDVAGAGDSMLIATALSLAAGYNIWISTLLGSIAAGIQVGRLGNTPIKASELLDGVGRLKQ
jgi:rfaE bifunctional protein kinase chain/domain